MSVSERQPSLLPTLGNAAPSIHSENGPITSRSNNISDRDRRFHDWYRFVLSYPPHLVRDYIKDFGIGPGDSLLDPFCGTGTTVVEAKLNGLRGIGLEANPFPCFASRVKTNWDIDPELLEREAKRIAQDVYGRLIDQGIDDKDAFSHKEGLALRGISPEEQKLIIKHSISPLPLHKTLVLLDCLREHSEKSYFNHALLALGNALVTSISNLRFGPEVGIGKKKKDVPVINAWLSEISKIARDIKTVSGVEYPGASVFLADAREASKVLARDSIDAVITSPPYPNEKDYTRTTRLESVLLGFYKDMRHIQDFKKSLVRSNTRSVYKSDTDDEWVANVPEIQRIADEIEKRRIELGKTSGFEKLYGRLTRLYFGGMARHLNDLKTVLRPGARLAYVVGDQASYLRVMIPTGRLLVIIAQQLGYEVVRVDLFRQRFATATQVELREEVVVLRWPG